jgi:hypothetical protein
MGRAVCNLINPVEATGMVDRLDAFREYPPGVTVVRDKRTAQRVLADLMELTDHVHACDTETAMIDDRHGIIGRPIPVICASIYAGDNVDFGTGPMIWIGGVSASRMCIRGAHILSR